MTLDKSSWGFRRNAVLSDYLTTDELITTLAQTVRSVSLVSESISHSLTVSVAAGIY